MASVLKVYNQQIMTMDGHDLDGNGHNFLIAYPEHRSRNLFSPEFNLIIAKLAASFITHEAPDNMSKFRNGAPAC